MSRPLTTISRAKWKCASCGEHNLISKMECAKCGTFNTSMSSKDICLNRKAFVKRSKYLELICSRWITNIICSKTLDIMRIESHRTKCVSLEECPCAKRAVFIQSLYRDWCRAHKELNKAARRESNSNRNVLKKKKNRLLHRSAYSTSFINTKKTLNPNRIKEMPLPSLSIADIIFKLLNEYNLSQLIEDCNHIDIAHCNDGYLSIFNFFESELGECNGKDCNIYLRSNRNRKYDSNESNRKKLYFGFINGADVAIITTLDTFHSFWFHSADLYEINAEKTYMRSYNDDDDDLEEKKCSSHYNGSKFITTVYNNNNHCFEFGEHFEYWQFYSKYDNFILAKYASLKEELLNNSIKSVDYAIYCDIECKVDLLIKTSVIKSMKAQRNFYNEIASICENSLISRSHLICIMIYTNHNDIQKKYKSTLRLRRRTETDYTKLKHRNSFIANWCRLLFESVRFWGNIMTKNDAFFHGIDRRLLFSSFYAAFKCPISTSTQISVAQSFKDNADGIIIKVNCASEKSMIPFLNVQFISDFRMESERLFYGADLNIIDIYYKKLRFDYMLRSISLFEHILSGGFFLHNKKLINNSNQKRLISLIENYLKYYDKEELIIKKKKKKQKKKKVMQKKRKYHHELFDYCVSSRKNSDIWLCLTEITSESLLNDLSSYFINKNRPGNFLLFLSSKWNINIKYSQEFDWQINTKNLDTFLNLPCGDLIQSPRYLYSLINKHSVTFYAECCRWSKDDPGWTDFYWNCEQLPNGVSEIQVTLDVISYSKKRIISHDIYEGEWMTTKQNKNEHHDYFGGKAFQIIKEFYNNNYQKNIPTTINQFRWRMAVRISTIAYTPQITSNQMKSNQIK